MASFSKAGVKWRSSPSFATLVVGLGVACDLLVYSIAIPVLPFRLEALGYTKVSSLSGWLVFAFSGGLVLSTLPIAMFSEHYQLRRLPLIFGLVVLLGSQIMFMEAPTYWLMVLARVLQGISSSMVWIVGLAMLCDTVNEKNIGRQIGIAMIGLSLGLVIGPPVGGVLYSRFGWRGPFIFGICVTFVDLLLRILFIERSDAIKMGYDPAALPESEDAEASPETNTEKPSAETELTRKSIEKATKASPDATETSSNAAINVINPPIAPGQSLSLISVIGKLAQSSRALVALIIIFAQGAVYTCQEPTIPLRLQDVWNLNSSKVGVVFLAGVLPMLLSSPITGWWADKHGTEWVTFLSLVLSLPFWPLLIIRGHLAAFIAGFALETFFMSGVVPPVTAELAAVSRSIEGVGYAHVYGAFNLAYGIGNAVGPIVGGQMYDHIERGWLAICLLCLGVLAIGMILSFFFVGEVPLFKRFLGLRRKNTQTTSED
ncbi:hypothetical protein PLICRDRAFT_154030 [Plicaturopsis crispa FD-325 SS-3]|nr:hypothetical protein PLICRDRAFT_154030 [Plicaturopsis crispa FD-325 SS-3]